MIDFESADPCEICGSVPTMFRVFDLRETDWTKPTMHLCENCVHGAHENARIRATAERLANRHDPA